MTEINLTKEQAKVRLLRATADRIENEELDYAWSSPQSCNVGSLVKTLNQDDETYLPISGSYTRNIVRCEVAGQPLNEVIQQLISFGFTRDELIRIELDDVKEAEYLEYKNMPKKFYVGTDASCRQHAVNHLRNIADEIEAKVLAYQSNQDKSQTTITVGVSAND